MTVRIIESQKNGVRVRIRLISSGLGSSGYYSPEVLEQYGPTAFPSGTHLFMNHLTETEYWDRAGSRDVRDLVGKTISEAEYIAEEQALYAEALIYNKNADLVKEIFEDIDLSIEAAGKKSDNGEVTELLADPHNAIALVPRGGRDGKITEFMESASKPDNLLRERDKMDSNESLQEKDKVVMTPEDIEKIAEAFAAKIQPALTQITESLKPKEPEAPEDDAVSAAEVTEALIAADLPKELRDKVYESADPIKEIENIKTIRESFASKSQEPAVGRVQEAGVSKSFVGRGWSKK